MLNYMVINGRLGQDPEIRTAGSVNVCSFSVAVDRDYRKQGEERQTDWIRCVAWRDLADFIAGHFTKGQLITLDGRLQVRNYTDRDGNDRVVYELNANHAWFCGSKQDNHLPEQQAPAPRQQTARSASAQQSGYPSQQPSYYANGDDSLPF